MLMPEERKILSYLRKHFTATADELSRACLPGVSRDWLERILANLDWLGYLSLYPGQDSDSALFQVTAKGLALAGGRAAPLAEQMGS